MTETVLFHVSVRCGLRWRTHRLSSFVGFAKRWTSKSEVAERLDPNAGPIDRTCLAIGRQSDPGEHLPEQDSTIGTPEERKMAKRNRPTSPIYKRPGRVPVRLCWLRHENVENP